MAAKKGVRSRVVIPANKASAEARKLFEADRAQRIGDQSAILSADDMAGLYDPKRGLFTTLGGEFRPVTVDDLIAFRAAVHDIQRRHGQRKGNVPVTAAPGGILAKQVVNLSAPDDRARASREIHTIIPISNQGGVVHITTNASAKSDVSRHHVYVQFLDYDKVLADGNTTLEAARRMLAGKLKFDCDCGRHTFWYRYIASIGSFNYGRPEDGFPRVRNPTLKGIACKHVIRVMATITAGATFNLFAKRMIENGRRTLSNKRTAVTVKEQQAFVEQMEQARKQAKRGTVIKTSEELKTQRQAQPSYQRQQEARKASAADRAAVRAANDKLRHSQAAKVNRKASSVQHQALTAAMKAQGFSEKQIAAALSAVNKVKG
ncbi:hypothetical protein KVG88_30335 [Pseudomonas sp. SWRI74]|uniref:Phage tail protein n=1 Tax=Pseudomonas azerbaijanoccidentalis TaxID=2842347 RepID=A0ABS6QZL3_9PSED|nr:hypothetical protein [Pseudomonas azerbaijanoccidentalis]MBV4524375.1 hypothetical protein [Pseudomonas azerbaijanoccidentalis]